MLPVILNASRVEQYAYVCTVAREPGWGQMGGPPSVFRDFVVLKIPLEFAIRHCLFSIQYIMNYNEAVQIIIIITIIYCTARQNKAKKSSYR